MLMGATGSGKTKSLETFIDAGVTPFVLFTEPGMRTLAPVFRDKKAHFKYIKPATPSWDAMLDYAKKLNTLSFQALTKLTDINKQEYSQWFDVITACNDFVCDCCNKSWGDIADWQTDRAFCLDSMSGLNIMAMDLNVGAKPVKAPGDWGIAMDNLERLIITLTSQTQCHFVLITHVEREKDEITGAVQLMASALGQKLAPKLPRNFDDVIFCTNKEGQFSWATMAANVDVNGRNLPLSKQLAPSFKPLIESWVKAGGVIKPTEEKSS